MNFKSMFGENKVLRYGFTTAELRNNILVIGHGGNMGNTIERSVNPNLNAMGIPSIEKLKKEFNVTYEDGSPDYLYVIRFKIK